MYTIRKTNSSRTIQVFSTSSIPKTLLMAYCCMLLVALTQSRVILLPSSTISHETIEDRTALKPVVEEAVRETSTTCNNLTSNDITDDLTNNIVQKFEEKGLSVANKCKPQTNQKLRELFEANRGSTCITLTSINLPHQGSTKEVFMVSTTSSCSGTLRVDAQCSEGDVARCSSNTTMEYITDHTQEYFPRFILSVKCGECSKSDTECLNRNNRCASVAHNKMFKLLKRVEDECDDEGFEKWEADTEDKHINVGCSCRHVER